MLIACLPFSEPLKTSGVWLVGFEKNDFFENPWRPNSTMMQASTGAALIVDEKIYRPGKEIEALQVDLVGRRALCPVGVINSYPIAVEKLRMTKRLALPKPISPRR